MKQASVKVSLKFRILSRIDDFNCGVCLHAVTHFETHKKQEPYTDLTYPLLPITTTG
jgi:hypothetical protein